MFHNGDHKIYYIKWLHINILKYISNQNAKLQTRKILRQGQAMLNHHQTKYCHIHLLKVKCMNEKMTVMRDIDQGWINRFSLQKILLWTWTFDVLVWRGKRKLSSNDVFTIKKYAEKWAYRPTRLDLFVFAHLIPKMVWSSLTVKH